MPPSRCITASEGRKDLRGVLEELLLVLQGLLTASHVKLGLFDATADLVSTKV